MKTNSLLNVLRDRLAAAVAQVAGREADPMLRPAQDPKFGDYQCNVAMSLAKPLKAKPRDIAQRIVDAAGLDDIAASVELAGPGFINIRLKPEFLSSYLGAIPAPATDDRLGMPPVETPLRVVIDYSCPNIAKQMHVGHLRTTIIGDVFARVLSFEGHEVIRQNHVGDWGTQFGMLIEYYRDFPLPSAATNADVLAAAEADYKAAQERFSSDPEFADRARAAVTRLQSGDPEARKVWEQLCDLSRSAFLQLYKRLGVLLTNSDERGESFYNNYLGPVVDELRQKLAPGDNQRGELRPDQGAECVFLTSENGEPRFKNPEGEPLPMIVQKKDGAYLYATTDLAAIRFRIEELDAKRIIYVTDSRQKLHFEMLFATARAAGWAGSDVTLEHVTFGTVLGPDRKPLKTRSGDTVKLKDLLDEAERRALEVLESRDEGDEAEWQTGGGATDDVDTAIASAAADATDDSAGKVIRFVARLANVPAESIHPIAPLKSLNADVVDQLLTIMQLEDELGISVPGDAAQRFQTVGDVLDFLLPKLAEVDERVLEQIAQRSSLRRHLIARAVGIGAVKYADLSRDRTGDYVFNWDNMLAFQGNTAPYMMYAHARIRSIYRKAAERFGEPDVYASNVALRLEHERELALGLRLARFREALDAVADDLTPHVLCTYLFELAQEFMRFYESCPVLAAPDEPTRLSRMRLCDITARTLRLGLNLLGIEALERM